MTKHDIVNPREPLLVIPHCCPSHIRVRTIEFARPMHHRYEIYCLRWPWVGHVSATYAVWRKVKQFYVACRSMRQPVKATYEEDHIVYIDIPFLEYSLLTPFIGPIRARHMARRFNTQQLERILHRYKIQNVLNAHTMFNHPDPVAGARVFYDVIDYDDQWDTNAGTVASGESWMQYNLSNTVRNFSVSPRLAERLAVAYGSHSIPVPNGVDCQAIQRVESRAVTQLKRELGIEDRYVLGYIGNHIQRSGVDFLLRVFDRVREGWPEVVLLIVGPYDHWKPMLPTLPTADVIFTGPVPPAQVSTYFNLIDMAAAPFEKWPLDDHCVPLTVLEYSAARKLAVVTNLDALSDMALPNVILTPRDEAQWVAAIWQTRYRSWQAEWDRCIEPYDWQALADRMADLMALEPAAA